MQELIQFMQAHPVLSALGAFFLFSNLVDAMEAPSEKSGAGYRYIYRLGHGLAGNLTYAMRARFPQFIQPEKNDVKAAGQ